LPRSQGQSPCSKCIEKYHPRRQIFDQSKDSTYECECEVPVVHSEEKYLLRHWNDIDGKLSLDVFGVFLCQIIDQIYAFPGITETRILKQFDYVCPRTSLLDFLARLELTGIIIKQRVKYQEPSPIPFSSNDSRDVDLICYQCSNVAIESVTSLFHQIQKESGLCQPEGSGSQMN